MIERLKDVPSDALRVDKIFLRDIKIESILN